MIDNRTMKGSSQRGGWTKVTKRVGSLLAFAAICYFFELEQGFIHYFNSEKSLVSNDLPLCTEARRFDHKSMEFLNIYIGQSVIPDIDGWRIQAYDQFISTNDIAQVVAYFKENHNEYCRHCYVRLFLDKRTPMSVVKEVKLKLREANMLRVIYMTWPASGSSVH